MQCDWEIEAGADAPVIDAAWPGFVDLRIAPERAAEIAECRTLPCLAAALAQLNTPGSPVWTAKCDVWAIESLAGIGLDYRDLDATAEDSIAAMGCYIDLLARSDPQWEIAARVEDGMKHLCGLVTPLALRACRADFIGRAAVVAPGPGTFGITAYFTACGHDPESARNALSAAVLAFADAVAPAAPGKQVSFADTI